MSNYSLEPISLTDWQLVKVTGEDNLKYLQGQVTIDMKNLSEHSALFAAHCDAKGRMWSNLLLFMRGAEIYYLLRKSVAEKQITELKKYAIFSKVTIEKEQDLNMYGIMADALPAQILSKFNDDNCVNDNDTTYIKLMLPHPRIIVITPQPIESHLQPSNKWLQLDLEAGYAIIDSENTESLLPQACNLQLYNAISFDKGCYCGQEMVARAQFRGTNKRGLYLLSGKSDVLPIIGDTIEYQIEGNWREGGKVLASLKLNQNHDVYVQVVLPNGIDINTDFRIKGQSTSKLNFH
ncbi:tRNA-modifying protein YgfZ [Gilliamella sp. CG16]|uniref:tRNA-modifying protein YgfZ n=1 Tax=Gilliamella sp. CG16 TaxID=3351503 RepID=UPI0039869367